MARISETEEVFRTFPKLSQGISVPFASFPKFSEFVDVQAFLIFSIFLYVAEVTSLSYVFLLVRCSVAIGHTATAFVLAFPTTFNRSYYTLIS